MLQFLSDGTLTALEVALSRQSAEKVYVTHKWVFKIFFLMMMFLSGCLIILHTSPINPTFIPCLNDRLFGRGKELAPLLLTCNAYVYICGDGNQMAKDVTNALARILQEHGDLSEESAQEFLDDMRSRRRLLMDVWS